MKLSSLCFATMMSSVVAENLLGYSPIEMAQFWVNSAICTGFAAYYGSNDTTIGEQLPGIVPAGAFFLDGGVCGSPDRKGEIPVGTELVFFVVFGNVFHDATDNVESADAECSSFARGTELFNNFTNSIGMFYEDKANYEKEPFVKRDGIDVEVLWLNADSEFYLESCPNGFECCDSCDDPECVDCEGVDAWPSFAWYYADSEEWKCGEERVYSFGATIKSNEGTINPCQAVTTTLSTRPCGDCELGDCSKSSDNYSLALLQLFFGWVLFLFGIYVCH